MATKLEREKMPHYKGYEGLKAWRVYHPKHGSVEVAAPSKDTAIVVAAEKWGRRWQDYDFYAYCDIGKM